ncbi:DNA methylase [Pseudomonas chlororaphis]
MISLNLNAVRAKQAESNQIAAAMADFWTRPGGTFRELPSARMEPRPARRDWVDPETVLKRKPRPLTLAERRALRKMADSL